MAGLDRGRPWLQGARWGQIRGGKAMWAGEKAKRVHPPLSSALATPFPFLKAFFKAGRRWGQALLPSNK